MFATSSTYILKFGFELCDLSWEHNWKIQYNLILKSYLHIYVLLAYTYISLLILPVVMVHMYVTRFESSMHTLARHKLKRNLWCINPPSLHSMLVLHELLLVKSVSLPYLTTTSVWSLNGSACPGQAVKWLENGI